MAEQDVNELTAQFEESLQRRRARRSRVMDFVFGVPVVGGEDGARSITEAVLDDPATVGKAVATAPLTVAPDVLGMAGQGINLLNEVGAELIGLPPVQFEDTISGDPIREMAGLVPDDPAVIVGEMVSPMGTAGKGVVGLSKVLGSVPDLVQSGVKLAGNSNFPAELSAILFHGSPFRFNRFSTEAIGSGEGAQAFGHGLYFAESKDVAKTYVPRDFESESLLLEQYKTSLSLDDFEAAEVYEAALLHHTPDELRELYTVANGYSEGMVRKAAAIADEVEDLARNSPSGHLYEVNVPDEVRDKMLDFDAPLSDQPELVAILTGIDTPIVREMLQPFELSNTTGGAAYRGLVSDMAEISGANLRPGAVPGQRFDEMASQVLRDAGVPGIRYHDAGSRSLGAAEGSRNMVLFDPADITSVKRDGEVIFDVNRR